MNTFLKLNRLLWGRNAIAAKSPPWLVAAQGATVVGSILVLSGIIQSVPVLWQTGCAVLLASQIGGFVALRRSREGLTVA
ncbi:hypothetical protein ASA1KI_27100 [Opitutales bacterium ASA1]|uniref:hypothetical protein n=1 Tax=Congregicoccus parvus TaxID=3081749 RepID=UPI002B3123E7|nr:hypothetical protein ASA1KI_27100 [Opitutales bacterium ASA1]